MSAIRLVTAPESYAQSKSGSVTGIIFFDFDDFKFPEDGWNDFVLVVLTWWLNAIDNLMFSGVIAEELRFMDGPFFLRVERTSGAFCDVGCYDERSKEPVQLSRGHTLSRIADIVIDAAKKVVSECSDRKWKTKDVLELKLRMDELVIKVKNSRSKKGEVEFLRKE